MSGIAWLAQKQLDLAAAQGEFDQFEGKGKPLSADLWGGPYEGDWELAYRILRQAEMAPRWIELDKEIRQRQQVLTDWISREVAAVEFTGRQRLLEQAASEIADINRLIELRNYLAPQAVRPRFKLKVEQLIAA